MRRFIQCLTAAAAVLTSGGAALADVGVSVSIGQPGFYGRIDVGSFPHPHVIYQQPVVIHPPAVAVVRQPIYLRVPPGHARDWGKHCRKYNACGQPVYFVRDDWYHGVYAPHYHGHRGDHRVRDRDHDRGRGHGHGRGRRDD